MNSPAAMTSRQRLLHAFNHEPVDHVPLMLRFWWLGGDEDHIPFDWQDQLARVENTLALGLDDTLLLEPPLGYVENYRPEDLPNVHSACQLQPPRDDGYALLTKTYPTPFGPLQTTVRLTDDWPHGHDIHLFDDYNIPRLVEPLIKTEADLPRLKHLLGQPDPAQIEAFRTQAADLHRHARRLGVIVDGGWTALGDAAMWLCGMPRILYGQMDEPDFIAAVLDVILEWELGRISLLLEAGVDVIVHSAWYEGTDFWTPASYRRLLKPRLAQMAAAAHAGGAKFRYIITKGWKPLRPDLLEIGVDCITGVDPVQDQVDLAQVKRELGRRVCLMGGVNSAVLFSQADDEQICLAVDQAVQNLAPGGGFILFPVDAVFNQQPWDRVQVLIDHWKAVRG